MTGDTRGQPAGCQAVAVGGALGKLLEQVKAGTFLCLEPSLPVGLLVSPRCRCGGDSHLSVSLRFSISKASDYFCASRRPVLVPALSSWGSQDV